MNKGLVYVFTGEGKGKTSAAIGMAVRAVGASMTVTWVAFYKQASWKLSEVAVLRKLAVEVFLMGKGFNLGGRKEMPVAGGAKVTDTVSLEEHRKAAEEALEKAKESVGNVDLQILDEVNNALEDQLVDLVDLIGLISKRKQTHLVLTGRDVNSEIVSLADLVTEMKKIKHPYDVGILAVRGLDF